MCMICLCIQVVKYVDVLSINKEKSSVLNWSRKTNTKDEMQIKLEVFMSLIHGFKTINVIFKNLQIVMQE